MSAMAQLYEGSIKEYNQYQERKEAQRNLSLMNLLRSRTPRELMRERTRFNGIGRSMSLRLGNFAQPEVLSSSYNSALRSPNTRNSSGHTTMVSPSFIVNNGGLSVPSPQEMRQWERVVLQPSISTGIPELEEWNNLQPVQVAEIESNDW